MGERHFELLGINFNTDLDKMAKGNYTEKIKLLETKQQLTVSAECYHCWER